MYRLHGFCQSGNTFKVAFLLRALKQPWEPVFVDFMNGVTRDPAVARRRRIAMGEVPVLDDGARRLTQSGVILTYLATKHGAFGGCDDDEQLEVLRWLLFDNHKFTSYFATYRFMKAFGPAAPDPAVMAWLRGRLDNAFGIVDKHLARRFMVGAAPTIADFSLCGYLFYPRRKAATKSAGRFPTSAPGWIACARMPGWAIPTTSCPATTSLRDGDSGRPTGCRARTQASPSAPMIFGAALACRALAAKGTRLKPEFSHGTSASKLPRCSSAR